MSSRPNIIWITLESTRADHTSLLGYDRQTTPELERIASMETGRSFAECIAHGIWTRSSSASILTGTYPSRHRAGMDRESIPDELSTVPELLSAAGYHTACLSPNANVSAATGLDRGFEQFAWFDKSTLLETAGLKTLAKFALNVNRHGGGFTLDAAKHGTGYLLTDVAKRWLRSYEGSDDPFFLYAHMGDPHHPYYPPRKYLTEYIADLDTTVKEANELVRRHHRDLNELIAHGCPFTDEEWETLTTLYDASIAYADELVGSIFDQVHSLDVGETVFVVTSDHGEFFGEHGLLAHKISVDDAVAHVPAVVHGDATIANHDGELIQHVDLVQSLLSRAQADTSQVQGIDLGTEDRAFAIIQRGADRTRTNIQTIREYNPDFDASHYHQSTVHAIRTGEYKYVLSDDGAELFHLPDESTDVSDRQPDVAASLEAELSSFLDTAGRPVTGEADGESQMTGAMRKQLEDLGYLV